MISKSYACRIFLYVPIFLYVLGDLFVFQGPLKQRIDKLQNAGVGQERAFRDEVAATVFDQSILLSQVDWEVNAYLWKTGQDPHKIDSKKLKMLRLAMLNQLIDDALLRNKIHYNQNKVVISKAEIESEYQYKLQAYKDEQTYLSLLKAQGVESKEEALIRIHAQLQQDAYVEYMIQPALELGDEELQSFYDAHLDDFTLPQRFQVRHLFLSTTDKNPAEVETQLDQLIQRLDQGDEFESLVAEFSDDERTKKRGGNLGWLADDERTLTTMRTRLLQMQAGQWSKVRTSIGWHYIQLLDQKPTEIAAFVSVKEEIRCALQAKRRQLAIKRYKDTLRYRAKNYIRVYTQVM